ncbi:MAG: ABC transporter permease subunit [Candidatus Dormibacteraeota bacterium]|uniref:ABC transporter permease subunit n=1 Tax=Candidatus Amunia macphersoniae TaxID=3127014 RepID=A0A934NA22_9BACT|nr:ABC transporter permease subunit [Candidatus Dormibacteraeota bacterium]
MNVLTIAMMTVREVSRRRLVLALVVLSAAAVALTGWGFSRLPGIRDQGEPISAAELTVVTSQLLIIVLFMFSAVLGLGAVMVASQSVSGEVESGQALAVLARPIQRAEVILGKWLGLGSLVVIYAAVATGIEFLVVRWATGYLPPHPITSAAFIAAEGLVLLTLTLLLSVRLSGITAGVIALMFFFITWIAGVAGAVGTALHNGPIEAIGNLSRLLLPSDGLWRGAIYNLEPETVVAVASTSRAAAANPFTSLAPPAGAYLGWAAFWVVAVVVLTILAFRHREL